MAVNPANTPELKLETEKKGPETVLHAAGRINLETCAALDKTLRDLIAHSESVVLDLANVDYIDSAGLGTLVGVHLHARRGYCELVIANPKQAVRDLFKRSGLASVFEHRSLDKLWDAWSGGNTPKSS